MLDGLSVGRYGYISGIIMILVFVMNCLMGQTNTHSFTRQYHSICMVHGTYKHTTASCIGILWY